MGTIRICKDDTCIKMSLYHLQDRRLSFKAVGLMSWMLSLPDGFDFSVSSIVATRKEGKDAIYTAMKELERAGYLSVDLNLHDARGQFFTIYHIHGKPIKMDEEKAYE